MGWGVVLLFALWKDLSYVYSKDTRVNIESPCSDVQERRETSGQVFTTWGNTLLWSYTHYSAELEQILRQKGFPGGSAGKESACNAGGLGLIPRLGRYPGEAILEWVATPVFWPEEFHGLYHSRGRVHPWDATEWLTLSLGRNKQLWGEERDCELQGGLQKHDVGINWPRFINRSRMLAPGEQECQWQIVFFLG